MEAMRHNNLSGRGIALLLSGVLLLSTFCSTTVRAQETTDTVDIAETTDTADAVDIVDTVDTTDTEGTGTEDREDGQSEDQPGRVLFISSYSYSWDTVQIQIDGIKEGIGDSVVLDYEFMDTKRVNDEESERLFKEGLAYRLSHVDPYDVIILGDDAALLFALKYREELFDGIPFVFEGVNDEELALTVSEDPMITGILEKLSVEMNVELGLALNPEATKVVMILDDSLTGEAERRRYYQTAASFPELEFSEINTSQLTTRELQLALMGITGDSILIYMIMTEDGSGRQYTNSESIRLITKYARVPAMRMVEGGIGEGLLGGNIVSMKKSGEIAAQIATDIINGRAVHEIGVVVDSPNIYCVDEEVMREFDLDLSKLPEDTVFVNEKKNFFERNREAVLPGSIIIVSMIVILLLLCFDNYKRRRLTLELEDARKIMETASQHDFLTGLPNRSKFMEDLEQAIRMETPCTVMMVDIDDFKQINDIYGHKAGDDALCQIADRLKTMQSPILTAYRYAGDEFIIILKSQPGVKIVDEAAYQCRQLFARPFKLAGKNRVVHGSIGIASYPQDTTDPEQLIVYADDAMYQVKRSGKNNFAFYSEVIPPLKNTTKEV